MAQNEAKAGLYAFNDGLRSAIAALNNNQPAKSPVFASNPTGFVAQLRSAAFQARHAATPEQARAALQGALNDAWSEPGNVSGDGYYRWQLEGPAGLLRRQPSQYAARWRS